MAVPYHTHTFEIPTATPAEVTTGTEAGKAVTPAAMAAVSAAAASAVQPGDLGNSAGLNVGTTAGTVAAGDDSRIVNALQPVDGRLNKINIPKFGGVFDVLDYIRREDPASAAAVEAYTLTGQDGDKVLTAVRKAGDDAMTYVRANARAGAIIKLPAGVIGMKDEFFSDDFQSKWWAQTGLLTGKQIIVEGAGRDVTTVAIRSDYVSSVRNTANGNQRDYGPWAGEPSPSALFPLIAKSSPTPASLSLRGFRMLGTDIPGVDPIAMFASSELNAFHEDIAGLAFANSGDVIMGSFNSVRQTMHFGSCGAQPIEGAAIMGNPAGFPPPWVWFDLVTSGGVTTVSAKARFAFGGYAIGDPVPFFASSALVGKQMLFHQSATVNSAPQTLRATIATKINDQSVTITIPAGVFIYNNNLTNRAGSFLPVKFTSTANSATITLSDAVKVGRGSRDMIGQIVLLPKAGSKANTSLDILSARIVSCDVGNDTDGYTTLTLSAQARETASDWFIWAPSHNTAGEEKLLSDFAAWNINDTDFIACRWEQAGGFNQDLTTSAFQFIAQDVGEAVQYISCKIHGRDAVLGMFGAEGQCIIDNAYGLNFVGVDFTHFGLDGRGQVRFMGAHGRLSLTAVGVGGWQLAPDYCVFYADPQSGYSDGNWGIVVTDINVKNTQYPGTLQSLFRGRAGLSQIDLRKIFSDCKTRVPGTPYITSLTSADALNAVTFSGEFEWGASAPSDAPTNGAYSTMTSLFHPSGTRGTHVVHDADNRRTWVRDFFSSAWSAWRTYEGAETATTAQFADATSDINTKNKYTGKRARNSINGYEYIASGSAATAAWDVFNRDSTVTPA